jgi:hypothetical protein
LLTDVASLSSEDAGDVMKVILELSDVEECENILIDCASVVILFSLVISILVNVGMVDMHPIHLATKYAKASIS